MLLLSEFLSDLVEDDAVVFTFNDRQAVVRTPLRRTLLARARFPRKDVLTALGEKEADRLTEMTKQLYLGQAQPEEVISQLRELADVR